jgi:hypothetical protein
VTKETTTGTPPRRLSTGRTATAVTVVLAGLALLFGAFVTTTGSAGATGTITVTQTPIPTGAGCVPSAIGRLSWTYTTESTSSIFRLTVVNPTPLCDPVDAVAAIYGMPDNGTQWPQQLLLTKKFTIGDASTTQITFSKDCTPVQFDVLTGETPKTIDFPGGPFHGPLLFPTDPATAQQFPGCVEPTTQVTTPSTKPTTAPTSSTTSSTTTTTAQVQAATTINQNPTSSTPATVESATTTNTASKAGNSLALTGAPSAGLAALGSLLLLGGLTLLVMSRWGRRAWA